MKKIILSATVLSMLIFNTNVSEASVSNREVFVINNDNEKTETFKVYGNCGMCKKTIESSLKGVKGIETADWNKETKMMNVTFNEKEISLDEIKLKIASVGYDTKEHRATEEIYNNLPGCCQYDRPEAIHNEDHSGHNH